MELRLREKCPVCKGTGRIIDPICQDGYGFCSNCDATGDTRTWLPLDALILEIDKIRPQLPGSGNGLEELASMCRDLAHRVEELEKAVDFAHAEIQKPCLKILED